MGLITGSKRSVVQLTPEQVEELRKLELDEEDFFRRGKSARSAKEKLLENAARAKYSGAASWQLSDDGKFLIVD